MDADRIIGPEGQRQLWIFSCGLWAHMEGGPMSLPMVILCSVAFVSGAASMIWGPKPKGDIDMACGCESEERHWMMLARNPDPDRVAWRNIETVHSPYQDDDGYWRVMIQGYGNSLGMPGKSCVFAYCNMADAASSALDFKARAAEARQEEERAAEAAWEKMGLMEKMRHAVLTTHPLVFLFGLIVCLLMAVIAAVFLQSAFRGLG